MVLIVLVIAVNQLVVVAVVVVLDLWSTITPTKVVSTPIPDIPLKVAYYPTQGRTDLLTISRRLVTYQCHLVIVESAEQWKNNSIGL